MRLSIGLQEFRAILPWARKFQSSSTAADGYALPSASSLMRALAAGAMLTGLIGCVGNIAKPPSTVATTTGTPPTNPPADPPTTTPPTTTSPADPPTNPPTTSPTDPPTNPPTTSPTDPPTTPPTTTPLPDPPLIHPQRRPRVRRPPSADEHLTTGFLAIGAGIPASAFIDSAGVVTHLSYTDTPYYANFPQYCGALQSLGIHHIRDGYYPWPSDSPIVQAHQQLAQAGIQCDYVVPLNSATTAESIESFSPEVGDMESLEAPNECDVPGNCGGTGVSGVLNMLVFLPVITSAAKDLNIPLLGPSFTDPASFPVAGNISSQISVNNLHVYFGGRNPGSTGWGGQGSEGNAYGSFAWWLDQAAIDAPGLPS